MRRTITTLILMFFCSFAYGQAEVWACQSQATAGLHWDGNKWNAGSFNEPTYLIKIDGENSTFRVDDYERRAICWKREETVTCNDFLGGTIFLNTETGKGGGAEIYGTTNTGSSRDTPTVSALQCTKI